MTPAKQVVDWVKNTPNFFVLVDDIGHHCEVMFDGEPTWFIPANEDVAKMLSARMKLYPEAKAWEVRRVDRAEVSRSLGFLRRDVKLKTVSVVHFVTDDNMDITPFSCDDFNVILNYIFDGQHKLQ